MNKKRVVITGMGVVSPNGVGLQSFTEAIKSGTSGIETIAELKTLNFSCTIGGQPHVSEEKKNEYFTPLQLRNFNSNGILFGVIAGMDALRDAKINTQGDAPNWDLGIVFGTGTSSVDKFRESIYKVDDGNVRRLGSTTVMQIMVSGVTSYLTGMTGAANRVITNSSACATGTEAIILGYEHIAAGNAKMMLCGSTSDSGPYIWAGFDALKVTTYKHNESPTEASRPMSEHASGFVPGSGAGALVLESLESALERNATIYAEVLGGAINSGGQRGQGSMTAPNNEAVQTCIKNALKNAGITSSEIDAINGHLTATTKDPVEIANWCAALERKGSDFPFINSLKSMVGHCLAASGSIESVAAVLQLHHGFIFPNLNVAPIHPEILTMIPAACIPKKALYQPIKTIVKASFGFGDVNACVIFRKKI